MIELIWQYITSAFTLASGLAADYWPLLVLGIGFYLFIELMEHSRDDLWNPDLTIFGQNIGRNWLNSGEDGNAWENKHNWKPRGLWKYMLVWLTDGEHFFQFLAYACVIGMVLFLAGWLVAAVAVVGILTGGGIKELFIPELR